MKMSDVIADFIGEMLSDGGGVAELQRKSLADRFSCVPSQINYVIETRFTPEHGYLVESQRGGGGFNPRSREGSDMLPIADPQAEAHISIHAPAKGATIIGGEKVDIKSISIHAPAKGATLRRMPHSLQGRYFNPRSREGSDHLRPRTNRG